MSALVGFLAFVFSLWPVIVTLLAMLTVAVQAAVIREQGKALRIARSNAGHARAELNRLRQDAR